VLLSGLLQGLFIFVVLFKTGLLLFGTVGSELFQNGVVFGRLAAARHVSYSIGILQCVDTTRDTVIGGRHCSDECGFSRAYEAIAEHTGQFGLAKGRVGT
jgi:hypothetical protein